MKNASSKILGALAVAGALVSGSAMAQDVLSLASASGATPGGTISIPISIQDNPATLLNESNGVNARIRGVNVKINVSPAVEVSNATITIPSPTVGNPCSNATGAAKFDTPYASGSVRTTIGWPDATGPVFTEGLAQPCLLLNLTFPAGAHFPITVAIDAAPATTSLTNAGGGSIESVGAAGNANLSIVGGTVTPVSLQKFDAE